MYSRIDGDRNAVASSDVTVRSETLNQRGDAVQTATIKLLVSRRPDLIQPGSSA